MKTIINWGILPDNCIWGEKGDNPQRNIRTSKIVKLISIEPLVVETKSGTHYKLENVHPDICKRFSEEKYKQKVIAHFSAQPYDKFQI